MKMEPTVSSETSAIRTQTPGNYQRRKKIYIYKYHTQSIHWHTSFTCLWRWKLQWVPKRRQLELRRRGITQKENIYKYHTQSIPWRTSFTCLWRWNPQWIPKRRQLELRRRGITQKETNYTKILISPYLKTQFCTATTNFIISIELLWTNFGVFYTLLISYISLKKTKVDRNYFNIRA